MRKTFHYKKVVHETEKAYLLTLNGGTDKWVPKSQVVLDEEAMNFTCPEWLGASLGLCSKPAPTYSTRKYNRRRLFSGHKPDWDDLYEGYGGWGGEGSPWS